MGNTPSSANPGIAPELNALPQCEIHQGDSSQFARTEPITDAGHQRRSPGDGAVSKPAAKSVNLGQADAMAQIDLTYAVINADDFTRERAQGTPGGARYDVRAPVTPQQALFGSDGERRRFDMGQAPDGRQLPNTTTQDNNAAGVPGPVDNPHPARPAVLKQPDISFLGFGPSGAWEPKK